MEPTTYAVLPGEDLDDALTAELVAQYDGLPTDEDLEWRAAHPEHSYLWED